MPKAILSFFYIMEEVFTIVSARTTREDLDIYIAYLYNHYFEILFALKNTVLSNLK